ncbi:MAG: hypothetical protein CMP81_24065 [Fulvimarina sp.]|nr:hypothetical protein [Fulvimarina sp.]
MEVSPFGNRDVHGELSGYLLAGRAPAKEIDIPHKYEHFDVADQRAEDAPTSSEIEAPHARHAKRAALRPPFPEFLAILALVD